VRSFLRDAGHADAYGALTVTWKSGSNPDLYLKSEGGTVVEIIDLSPLKKEQIHALLTSKGLERNASGAKTAPHVTIDKKTVAN
jgi:hypothetical protein